MRRPCLRLQAKGVRCSCRAFAVEGDVLARVVPSTASSMGLTSSILHGKSILDGDCSLWLEFPLQGSRACLGFSQRARHPVHQNTGVRYLRVFDRIHSSAAEVPVKVTAFVTDTISIRVACLL